MVNGLAQVYGEWPHYVRLNILVPAGFWMLCGGVIISHRHILTANHCVEGADGRVLTENIQVIAGEDYRDITDPYEQVRGVRGICYSSRFQDPASHGMRYDYAILELDRPLYFNNYVQPACLPYEPLPLEGARCFVMGLGIMRAHPTDPTRHVFPAKVRWMQLKCARCGLWSFRGNDRSRHCFTKANGEGDTCGGDSGGPVVCLNSNKRWVVMGLVSYGSQLCDGTTEVGWVGVYTRVKGVLKQMQADCGV